MTIRDPFILTDGERASTLWRRLRDHFEQRLVDLRGQNDGDLDQFQTAKMRGQIECLKGIISLGDEPPLTDG